MDIGLVHKRLQSYYDDALVLIGGSYAAGEYVEGVSDIDFYVIAPTWRIWRYLKRKKDWVELVRVDRETPLLYPEYSGQAPPLRGEGNERNGECLYSRLLSPYRGETERGVSSNSTQENPLMKSTLIFIPCFMFKRGWYYVWGKDLEGKERCSGIDRKMIFRHSLKAAYFHLLRSRNSQVDSVKQNCLWKCAQQVAWAKLAINCNITNLPVLTAVNQIVQFLKPGDRFTAGVLTHRLDANWWQKQTMSDFESNLLQIIRQLEREGKSWLGFYWPNYVIYNLHFLRKGIFKFLFCNPDKKVLKIEKAACASKALDDTIEQVNKIVCPILSVKI